MTNQASWVGVDLDGTLAHYGGHVQNGQQIGPAIPAMLERVQRWIRDGVTVKIFTARANEANQIALIRDWLRANGLPELEITATKDYACMEIWDDRAVEVISNTGRVANPLRRLVPAAVVPEVSPG